MSEIGIGVDGSSEDIGTKYVFSHAVAGARVFIGNITQPNEDPMIAALSKDSWAVFQGVGTPQVNPLMPSLTYHPMGLWVCEDDAVGKAVVQVLNTGRELGFTLYTGDVEVIKLIEARRTDRYVIT